MGKQFDIIEPYYRVIMPNGQAYDAGDTVVLSDADYAKVTAGMARTFVEDDVTDVDDPVVPDSGGSGGSVTDAGTWFVATSLDDDSTPPSTDGGITTSSLFINAVGDLPATLTIEEGDVEVGQPNFVQVHEAGIYLVFVVAQINGFNFPTDAAATVSINAFLRYAPESDFSFSEAVVPQAGYYFGDTPYTPSMIFPTYSPSVPFEMAAGSGLDVSATFTAYTEAFASLIEDGEVNVLFKFNLLKIGAVLP